VGLDEMARELVPVLRLLAASSHEQHAYLEQLGTWPSLDELALELDDLVGNTLQLPAAPLDPAEHALQELDLALHEMTAFPGALWEGPALATDERWAEVRRLAARALAALVVPSAG
jgi:hypothetical protein